MADSPSKRQRTQTRASGSSNFSPSDEEPAILNLRVGSSQQATGLRPGHMIVFGRGPNLPEGSTSELAELRLPERLRGLQLPITVLDAAPHDRDGISGMSACHGAIWSERHGTESTCFLLAINQESG
eukprot:3689614-Prymnesium_polylepis.1